MKSYFLSCWRYDYTYIYPSTSLHYWSCGDCPCWKSYQACIVCEDQLATAVFHVFKVPVYDGYFRNGFCPQVPMEMMGKWLVTTVWSNNKLLAIITDYFAYKCLCSPFSSSGWHSNYTLNYNYIFVIMCSDPKLFISKHEIMSYV